MLATIGSTSKATRRAQSRPRAVLYVTDFEPPRLFRQSQFLFDGNAPFVAGARKLGEVRAQRPGPLLGCFCGIRCPERLVDLTDPARASLQGALLGRCGAYPPVRTCPGVTGSTLPWSHVLSVREASTREVEARGGTPA